MHATFRNLTAALVASAGILSAACSSVAAPDAAAVAGPYSLVRVNGQPVPAALDHSVARSLDVVSGTLILHPDGRATGTSHTRITEPGAAPVTVMGDVDGTFTVAGDKVILTFPSGFSHSLEILADGLRLRTVGMHCTGECPLVTGILHIYEYERGIVVGR